MQGLEIPKLEDASRSSLPWNSNRKGGEAVSGADISDPSTRVPFPAAKPLREALPSGESTSLSMGTSTPQTLVPSKSSLYGCSSAYAGGDLPPLLTSPLSRHQAFFKTSDPVTHSAVIAHDTHCVEPVVRTKFDAADRRYLQTEALILYQEQKHIKAQKELLACEEMERRDVEVDGLCLLEALAGWQREIKENLFGNKTASRALARLMERLQDRMDVQCSVEHDEEMRLKNEGRMAWEKIVEKQRQLALEEKENARLQREKMNMERRAIVFLIAEEKRQRASLEMIVIKENDEFFDALVPARAADEEQITLYLRRRSEERAAKEAKQQKEAKRLRIELARDERLFGVTQKLMIDACRHGPRKTSLFTGAHRKTECLQCRVRYDEEWKCYVSMDHPDPPPAVRLMMNKQKTAVSANAFFSSPISSDASIASPGAGRRPSFMNGGAEQSRHTAQRRRSASLAPPIRSAVAKRRGLEDGTAYHASTPTTTAVSEKRARTLEAPKDLHTIESPRKGRRLPAPSVDKRKKHAPQVVVSPEQRTTTVKVEGSETQKGRRKVGRGLGRRRGKEGPRGTSDSSVKSEKAVSDSTGTESTKDGNPSSSSEKRGVTTHSFFSAVKKNPTETHHEMGNHAVSPGRSTPTGKTAEEWTKMAQSASNPEQESECQKEDVMIIPIPPSSSPDFAPRTPEERMQHLKLLLSKTKGQELAGGETLCFLPSLLQDGSERKDVGMTSAMGRIVPSGVVHTRAGRETETCDTAEGVAVSFSPSVIHAEGKEEVDHPQKEFSSPAKKMQQTQGKFLPLASPMIGTSVSSPIPRMTAKKGKKGDILSTSLPTGTEHSPHSVVGDKSTVVAVKDEHLSPSRSPFIVLESKAHGDGGPSGAGIAFGSPSHSPGTIAVTGDGCVNVHGRDKEGKEVNGMGRTSGRTTATALAGLLSGGGQPTTAERVPHVSETGGGLGGTSTITSLLVRRSLPSLVPTAHRIGMSSLPTGVPEGKRMTHSSSRSRDGGTAGAGASMPRVSLVVEGNVEKPFEGEGPSHSHRFNHLPQKKPFLSKNFKSPSCAMARGNDKTLDDKRMEWGGGVRRGVAFIETSETSSHDAAGVQKTKNFDAAAGIRVDSAVAFSSPIPTISGGGASEE